MNTNFEKYITVLSEVKQAYSDCHDLPFDGGPRPERSLDFIASELVTKAQAKEILEMCVTGYNNFEPDLLDSLPEDSLIKIAREGSVCLYVKSNELTKEYNESLKKMDEDFDSYIAIPRLYEVLALDEFSYESNELFRLWWD